MFTHVIVNSIRISGWSDFQLYLCTCIIRLCRFRLHRAIFNCVHHLYL